ncbi:uncharacterized protein BDZ99DRAFT_574146 [Mytilinidion resinicola]|uniref:Uncharacterized protein n=1 Tax=Mytilinidion resinicola TaxID=574789 RepID=A0A6A6YAL3_9PEZI|nr:uncharacterized protein BDZ99DRAFT_574146 [Mytilinidion resinicola]KAF2805861.1 hypothetical protein BDZ99DRAFT_574146 [Mytilinidion resinicola]
MNNVSLSPLAPSPQAVQAAQSSVDPTVPFDDKFLEAFASLLEQLPNGREPTYNDRNRIIKQAHALTESLYYPAGAPLSPGEKQQKALTRVLCYIMAEQPWLQKWIRPQDVERKLSRFEWAPGSQALAQSFGFMAPVDAIKGAREELKRQADLDAAANVGPITDEEALQEQAARDTAAEASTAHADPAKGKGKAVARDAPFDDIEVIYVPGTVSSDATNAIDRTQIYPISVESVAWQLENHMCKDMTRPWDTAFEILHATAPHRLQEIQHQGRSIIDFAPHLLDNDNISLLIVLLIIPRAEICSRFAESGIRVEGSTMSHRKSELMKHLLGWLTQEDKWGFDSAANELQKKIKAVSATPKSRTSRPRQYRKAVASSSTTPGSGQATWINGGGSNGSGSLGGSVMQAPGPDGGSLGQAAGGYGGFFGHGGVGGSSASGTNGGPGASPGGSVAPPPGSSG